jgi:hypothetical protein
MSERIIKRVPDVKESTYSKCERCDRTMWLALSFERMAECCGLTYRLENVRVDLVVSDRTP